MTIRDFIEKWDFNNERFIPDDVASFFVILDHLYLEWTKEKTIAMITEFFDNADDIYNSLTEETTKMLQHLATLLIEKESTKDLTDEDDFDDEDMMFSSSDSELLN